MDLAMRLGGRQPGGAAKIATIASGLFGMISGSAVANVATTGNFTIPMMIRLGYPRPFAAAVEAVASTGGQIAPPIMGAAAFVMAEILGVPYLTIIVAAILPAVLFYLSVFMTVHFVALKRGLAVVPDTDMPEWRTILAPRRVLPILAALGGLGFGIWLGRSVATSAFYGILGLLVAFISTETGRLSLRQMAGKLIDGLEDAGKGLVIIGVLLAGAQVLVSMINLTGIGVTLSSLIVSVAGDSMVLVALIVGVVCLIMGMGLPTTAAYVLVAAVLAPAMTAVGVDPLAAHLFVFYFATISVITPPVCVAVFVGSGIAGCNWLPASGEAVRLGAVTYIVPFLLLLYPGMLLGGGPLDILEAIAAGLALVVAVPALLAGMSLFGQRLLDTAIYIVVIALAIYPHPVTPFVALALLAAAYRFGRPQRRAVA
jgi:TRAP transporter 4TM/12TM fusion protein